MLAEVAISLKVEERSYDPYMLTVRPVGFVVGSCLATLT